MRVLPQDVLLWDFLSPDMSPRYELNESALAFIYSPRTGNVVRTCGEEVLVPMTPAHDINWDRALISLLAKSAETNKNNTLSCDSIDDYQFFVDSINAYFDKSELCCGQVIVHPDNAKEIELIPVRQSDKCAKDKAYFLPHPQFLGVFANQYCLPELIDLTESFREPVRRGMVITNSNLVLEVTIKAG